MKITGIISSPNFKGNTATLVRETLKGAKDNGAEIKEIFLENYNIKFCKGCLLCLSGECPLKDDFNDIKEIVKESDGIIIGSPTYGGTHNAMLRKLMERFGLFERMTSEIFGGKYAVGISSAGGSGAEKTAKENIHLIRASLFKKGFESGTLGFNSKGLKAKDNPEILNKAYRLGKKLVNDIQTKKTYAFQALFERFLTDNILKPNYTKIIKKNKNGLQKEVYRYLTSNGLITE